MPKPKFTGFKVSLSLPYIGGIEGTWQPNEDEKKAAWEMYVELVTRIFAMVQPTIIAPMQDRRRHPNLFQTGMYQSCAMARRLAS